MSFLSGSPWQQPGIISGGNGYGQPSSSHQQQQQHQQQHKPSTTLSGSSIPTVLASSPLLPHSPASDWHCQGQMAPGGQVAGATQGGSKITLTEEEGKLGRGRTEGTLSGSSSEAPGSPSFRMPMLKIEDEGSMVGRAGRLLGSEGQSPSSPMSPNSSPSSSVPSPSISPGRSFPTFVPDCKPTPNPNFRQNNVQQNYTGSKDGFYIQGSQVSAPVLQGGERNTLSPCFTGSSRSSQVNEEDKKKSVSSPTPGGLLGSLKEYSAAVPTGNQTLRPSLARQSVIQPTGTAPPPADLTGSKAGSTVGPTTSLPSAPANRADTSVAVSKVGETGVERDNWSHPEKGKKGPHTPPGRGEVAIHSQSQDLGQVEDERGGSSATSNRETKNSQSTELPQRTAVRRAMSDCSHLSVPMVMAATYPTGIGGLSVMVPNVPNFTMMGTACPPRGPYPHAAVRRSLTVSDGTGAAAMATMMSSPLMMSPVMPSSPPPKRQHGTCETNFLLAVPPHAGTSNKSTQDNTVSTTVKSDNKDKQEKTDIMSMKTDKSDTFDKKEKEEQQKKDNGQDKNQKSEKIVKDDEKMEKMNAEKNNKANEKAEKVDKPEKTNKDEKKEEEKKPAEKKEEKGGKGTAKSPTGNGSKTLPSPDSKSKTPENGTAEKRPVPKATSTPRAPANKNGSSVTAANKTAATKNDKTENKTGEPKKPKTTARPRPASTIIPATPAASTNGEATHRRRVITKPPVPKQTPMEKKPPVPRAPRTPRPINAPTPDLKNVRSKIGSIDNIKYQPGGGKVSSTPNNKASDASTHAAKARVQILNKKVDVSKVTSKCGSKDNIKYKPGGGDVKIDLKNNKAKSKVGSMDNVGPGNGQANGHKEEKIEEKVSLPPGGTTAPGGVAKENGVKEPTATPFGGDGLREPLSIDKRITETN